MWLHIQNNDKKFLSRITAFNEAAAPGENIYVVNSKGEGELPAGVKLIENSKKFIQLLNSRSDWAGIIFYPLAPKCWKWLKHIPEHIPVVWYRFGYEAYEMYPYLRKNYLYMSETKRLVHRTMPFLSFLKWLRAHLPGRFKPLRRVDVFVGPEHQEYELYREADLLSKRTVWKFGGIGSLEDICNGVSVDSHGQDIKVGNSSDPSNNHVEAFRWLSKFDLSGRKVITPLGYGENRYRDVILRKGEEILGKHFEPIVDFLTLEKYNRLCNRCGYVMMNHLRQQAGGNIVADLWRGSKVYMNNTTSYKSRKSWGLSVELISEQSEETFFTPKSPEVIESDRSILQEKRGRTSARDNTRKLFQYFKQLAL